MKGYDMAQAHLMDTPADYRALGVDPNNIQLREDGRRSTPGKGHWEWWYFDTILSDGTTVVIQDFTKGVDSVNKKEDHPMASIKVTLPSGEAFEDHFDHDMSESQFSTDRCDVKIGPHTFTGDFKNYHIHIEPKNGLGADLDLHSTSKPYRPGTAYWGFGDNDENRYTWLCSVPKGSVSGTLTVNGQTRSVEGPGYHDHQWGTNVYMTLWNNWVWARQGFDDYSLLVFDMVTSKKYDYKRFPVVFLQDAEGDVVFEDTKDVKVDILEEYQDEKSGKTYPSKIHYTFQSGDKTLEYTLTQKTILDNIVPAKDMPMPVRIMFKTMGLQPSYARYQAQGDLTLTQPGKTKLKRSGELIYEFMYPGVSYR